MSGHCERCGETAACCCHSSDVSSEQRTCNSESVRAPLILELANCADRIAALEAANAKQAARIAELEDEREKLEKQEPVAFRIDFQNNMGMQRFFGHDDSVRMLNHHNAAAIGGNVGRINPLYARPVPARTLTDEVMREIHSRLPITYTYDELMLATQAWLKGGE